MAASRFEINPEPSVFVTKLRYFERDEFFNEKFNLFVFSIFSICCELLI